MDSVEQTSLGEFARRGEVVVMAGAGVSAGKPTALPGWKPLNEAIVRVLGGRLESALHRPDWLSEVAPLVDAERNADRFPPEYQAQLIEEMCGERYFQALQALDVDVLNAAHDGIAALAAARALKAVVTTNFDRLIEHALDRRGVDYVVAYDDTGFVELGQRLRAGRSGLLPIIKIHGCVSAHKSMIDTLKQRKRGRSRHLEECLDTLHSGYWLYLGFSAEDLEGKPDYLGLVAGAARSPGATYVAYPGNPALREGAQLLMNAFEDRGRKVVADIAVVLGEVCSALDVTGPAAIAADATPGLARFQEQLQEWSDALSPAAAGLCLAAILEAVGRAEAAVRIMDRLVRKDILQSDQDTADFRALQLHYGRLGAAWGRFIAVPDLGGSASNISVETLQSLLRLLRSDLQFAASSWLACLWLWLNQGEKATRTALQVTKAFVDGHWEGSAPRTDEEAVDAWVSAAQVGVVSADPDPQTVVSTADEALERARRAGDVVRAARVAALKLLAVAATMEDVPSLAEQHEADFAEATRVGDAFALGMRSLALGRWYVGAGGLALALTTDAVAQQALSHLEDAATSFEKQGMHPWVLFSLIQQAKAHADLRRFEDAGRCIEGALEGAKRFPVLTSHVYEAVGQIHAMRSHLQAQAAQAFKAAVDAAKDSGLLARQEYLRQYLLPSK